MDGNYLLKLPAFTAIEPLMPACLTHLDPHSLDALLEAATM